MIDFLAQNIGTIAVALVLAAIITMIIIRLNKNKKAGNSSCGCGCGSCPKQGSPCGQCLPPPLAKKK